MANSRIPNQRTKHDRAKGTTTWNILVTKELMEKAIRGSSSRCAVANAIKEQIPGASQVTADLQTVRFSIASRGERYVYLTPRVVQQYITDYDAGDFLQEFRVQLRHPGVTAVKTTIPKGTGSPRAPRARVVNLAQSNMHREGGKTPPMHATTTRRVYGLRQMRINQAEKDRRETITLVDS